MLLRIGLSLALWLVTTSPAVAVTTIVGEFESSAGLRGSYRADLPDNLSRNDSAGLLFFFHADGASGGDGAASLRPFAASRRLVMVSMQVPSPSGAVNECWWAPAQASNAEYVAEWIEELADGQPAGAIDLDRVFFSGISGGGEFALNVNAHLGYAFGGGAVAVCGGDVPLEDGGSCFDGNDPPPTLDPPRVPSGARGDFHYFIDISADDFLRPLAKDARRFYRDEGFSLLFHTPSGRGHCDIDEPFESIIARRVSQALDVEMPVGCQPKDIREKKVLLESNEPVQLVEGLIPFGDPARDEHVDRVRRRRDKILAITAELPDLVLDCDGNDDCPSLHMGDQRGKLRKKIDKLAAAVSVAIKAFASGSRADGLQAEKRAIRADQRAAAESLPSGRSCEG